MSEEDKTNPYKKKYTQHYRRKWEQIPQLRGWLSMFPHKDSEKVKAFCKYCQRKLVPHVTGLLKHAACKAHLKNARVYMERIREGIKRAEEKAKLAKEKKTPEKSGETGETSELPPASAVIEMEEVETTEGGRELVVIKQADNENGTHFDDDNDMVDEYSDEEIEETIIPDPASNQVKIRVVVDDAMMSTHVLDTTRGCPVIGLGVSLYRLQNARWTLLSDGVTDAEGRCNDLLKDNTIRMEAGRYKMHYDVSQYYAIRNQECFFPFIEVVFDISNPTEKYHIPLLLSPFSYSTYRGC